MKINYLGPNQSRAIEKMRKDNLMRNLMTKQPEEIIDWWNNTATAQQKDAMMLRLVILVAGLARNIDFT